MTPELLRAKLVKFIGRKVGDPADVEDIVQETMLAIFDSLPLYQGKSRFLTWVYGIAKHEIADFYRKKKIKQVVFSRLPFLKDLVSEALGPELEYQEIEAKTRILKTLKKLSEGYSRVLRLKYIDGLTMDQIAQQLNLTVKAVESRLTRARLAFQKIYDLEEDRQTRFTPFD
jgi:RNA polymerase sigma-70 factor (ECF subfamily)